MSDTEMLQQRGFAPARRGKLVTALAFYLRGNSWAEFGNLDLAIADYNAALAINPMLAAALAGRGDAWARKGDLDRAITDYSTALQLNPHDLEARKRRAMALDTKQEWKAGENETLN